jgi:Domain of unknwon function (DUF3824)
MSVYARDRFDDSRTSVSSARRDGGRDGGYTTVKRYVVKDDDSRSSVGRDRRSFVPERAGERVEETRIVRREREVDDAPVREVRRDEPRYSTNELVIRTDKEDDRRGPYYRRDEPQTSDRELVIRRTTETAEPRRDDFEVSRLDDRRDYRVSETRYRDDYQVGRPDRGGFDDRDLQRYTRNTEYFAPAPHPQTIIIKQEPIIIRERVREDDYQMVRRQDVEESRSIVRRDPSPKEEEFFYEKKVRERIDDEPRRRRDHSEDSWHERRTMRREVSPHDSVSQVGGRQRRGSYSSDDSMVYVRRTKEYDDDSRGSSPHNKRNLAAGVVAGIGAAELLRNHKKKEGRETSHGVGRLGRDVGAGALGAIAAEGISRARSQYRSRSRRGKSRGRSDSRSRSRSRRRSRSRSESRSKLKTLGAVGLGAVALAAAAAVAQRKMSKKKEEGSPDRGRSHSRGRGETVEELANDPTADNARNPKHRNIRMAEAGAAGAAITALLDRARSKSRGGRDRSQSRIRQAVPVVAAGLGSAALAGLYEKNKAKKEAEVIANEERSERRRQSRSRSRQRSDYYDGPSQAAFSDPHLIEYGDGPMHGNNFGPDYYGRPAPQEPYYAQQTAVVPATAAAAGGYAAARGGRSRSRSRDRRSRSRSASSSPGGHRHRHRSRDAAEAATAAGIGAVAASEHERRKREKRERKARKRTCLISSSGLHNADNALGAEEQHDPYEDTYNPSYTPQPDPYAQYPQQPFYPQSSQFPPPPGSGPQPYPAGAPTAAPAGAAYNPTDFPPPPPPPGAPPGPGYDAYASGANPYAPRRDENVSVPPSSSVPSGTWCTFMPSFSHLCRDLC